MASLILDADAPVGDNQTMDRPKFMNPLTLLVFLGLLGGCGMAEWPPPTDVNASPGRDAAFRNASAVVVGRGDTVYGLSRRHGVSMRAIIDANGLQPPFLLDIGRRIVLPRLRQHLVRSGDTLGRVANAYDIELYDLARLNGLKPPYMIYVDQRLRLPDRTVGGETTMTTVSVSPNIGKTPPPPALLKTPPVWDSSARKKPTAPAPVVSRPTLARAVTAPPPASGRGFIWPVKGPVISGFGAKAKGLRNDGINISARRGTPVRAVENGVVVYAGNELRGFGNLLLLKHADGWVSAYAHNERLTVERGAEIEKGQTIATVGSSGGVSSPQLHFELRKGKRARDPRPHLRGV